MCKLCSDVGFVRKDVPLSHPDFGKAFPCACLVEKRKTTMLSKLNTLDGLTASERARSFDSMQGNKFQGKALERLRAAEFGIILLHGNPGVGKTHLMHCVINHAKANGRVAVYATMTDVLDYLREAFSPKNEEPFEERWRLLLECPVLCVDELDEFSVTGWARERFLRLIDERWRQRDTKLTVFALNGDPTTLLPKVASRIMQGEVIELRSPDLRPHFRDLVPA